MIRIGRTRQIPPVDVPVVTEPDNVGHNESSTRLEQPPCHPSKGPVYKDQVCESLRPPSGLRANLPAEVSPPPPVAEAQTLDADHSTSNLSMQQQKATEKHSIEITPSPRNSDGLEEEVSKHGHPQQQAWSTALEPSEWTQAEKQTTPEHRPKPNSADVVGRMGRTQSGMVPMIAV
jgi:hypothetical protein